MYESQLVPRHPKAEVRVWEGSRREQWGGNSKVDEGEEEGWPGKLTAGFLELTHLKMNRFFTGLQSA